MADENIGNDPITEGKQENNLEQDIKTGTQAARQAKQLLNGVKNAGKNGSKHNGKNPTNNEVNQGKQSSPENDKSSPKQQGTTGPNGNEANLSGSNLKEQEEKSPANEQKAPEGDQTDSDQSKTDQPNGGSRGDQTTNQPDSKESDNRQDNQKNDNAQKKNQTQKSQSKAAQKTGEQAGENAGEQAAEKAGEKAGEQAGEKTVETAGTAAGGIVGKVAGKVAGKLVMPAVKLTVMLVIFFMFLTAGLIDSLPSYIYNSEFLLRPEAQDDAFKDVGDLKAMYLKANETMKTDYNTEKTKGKYTGNTSIDMLFLYACYSSSMEQYDKDPQKDGGGKALTYRFDMLAKLVTAFPKVFAKTVLESTTSDATTKDESAPATVADLGGGDYTLGSITQLVNKSHAIDANYTPSDLADLSDTTVRTVSLRNDAKAAFETMQAETLQNQNISFSPHSGYRSYETQTELYAENGSKGDTAKPGESEHQLGLAIDISCAENSYAIDENFEDTSSGKYLAQNAHKYGFILRYQKGKQDIVGYVYEPWHFRYVGVATATAIFDSGLTMEEYYSKLAGGTVPAGTTTGSATKTQITVSDFKKEWIFTAFYGSGKEITDLMPNSQYTYEDHITFMMEMMKKDLGIENGLMNMGSSFGGNYVWPIDKPFSEFSLAEDDVWGWRVHPIFGNLRFHDGLDLSTGYGDNIYSAAAGSVSFAGNVDGYGNKVLVDHGNGIQTLYGHNQELKVKTGDTVTKGQLVALEGSTGNSTGPHLHFGAYTSDGVSFDPMDLYKSSLVGNGNLEQIWNYLISMGCTPEAAAGVMGNFAHESGSIDFDTSSIEIGNGAAGFGIAQWSFDRRKALEATAAAKGVAADDLAFQLEFFASEVADGSSDVYFRNLTNVSSWEEYKTITDITRCTYAFEGAFERSSAKAYTSRTAYANEVYRIMHK